MSLELLDEFGIDLTLVKQDGRRVAGRGIWGKGRRTIIVHDKGFPVAAGDTIEHVLPNTNVETYVVTDPGYHPAPAGSGLDHYEIKIRHSSARSGQATSSVVHNYNNSGVVNAMGPDAIASHNTNNISITHQTLNLSDPRIATELAELRKALAAEVDDDDAAVEVGHVVKAQRALKDGDGSGFTAAMKRLGRKAWNVAEKLALTWMTQEGRHQLGLPPG